MYDVITVGSATVDAFVKTETGCLKVHTRHGNEIFIGYPAGEKILINHLEFMTGGGATNTAVATARLGFKTACLCSLGNDNNSRWIINELKKEKIDFIGTKAKDMTSYSVILDSVCRDRTILTYKGASNFLNYSKINKSKLKAKWFYFCTMLHESYKTLEKLALYAERNKINIAFNTTNYLAEKGPKYLSKILKRTTMLVLNKEEAELLTKKKEINAMLKQLLKYGPKMAVLTDGEKGAYVYDGKFRYYIHPRKVKVLETTGAGDAFTSTFMAGYIKTKNIEFSLRLAQTNAESVIQHYGAKNKLLTWREAITLIKKYPHKVVKTKL